MHSQQFLLASFPQFKGRSAVTSPHPSWSWSSPPSLLGSNPTIKHLEVNCWGL
jgi:hypothetical protein